MVAPCTIPHALLATLSRHGIIELFTYNTTNANASVAVYVANGELVIWAAASRANRVEMSAWLPLIFSVCMFLTYWGGMAGIIWLDGQRQRAKASVVGNVDFIDRRPGPYMLLGAFCGPLPLIFYFGTTRKSGDSSSRIGDTSESGV